MEKKWIGIGIIVIFAIACFIYYSPIECPSCNPTQPPAYQMAENYLGANIYETDRVEYTLDEHVDSFDLKINSIPKEIHHGYEVPYLQSYWDNLSLMNIPRTTDYSIGHYAHPVANLKDRLTEINNYMSTRDEQYPLRGADFGYPYGFIDIIPPDTDPHAYYNYFGWQNYLNTEQINEVTYPYQAIKYINVKLVPMDRGTEVNKNLYTATVQGSYYLGAVSLHGNYNTPYYLLYEVEIAGKESAVIREMIPVCEGILWDLKTVQTMSTQLELSYRTWNVNKVQIKCTAEDGTYVSTTDECTDGKNTVLISGLQPNMLYEVDMKIVNGESKWGYPIEQSLSVRTGTSDIYDRVLINFDHIVVKENKATIYWYVSYDDITQEVAYYTAGETPHTITTISKFQEIGATLYFVNLPNLTYNSEYNFSITARDREHSTNYDVYKGHFTTQHEQTPSTNIKIIRSEYGNDYIKFRYIILGEYTSTKVEYIEGEFGAIESVRPEPFGTNEYLVKIDNLKEGTEYTVKVFSDEETLELHFKTGTTGYVPTPTPPSPDDEPSTSDKIAGFLIFLVLVGIVILYIKYGGKKKKGLGIKIGGKRY